MSAIHTCPHYATSSILRQDAAKLGRDAGKMVLDGEGGGGDDGATGGGDERGSKCALGALALVIFSSSINHSTHPTSLSLTHHHSSAHFIDYTLKLRGHSPHLPTNTSPSPRPHSTPLQYARPSRKAPSLPPRTNLLLPPPPRPSHSVHRLRQVETGVLPHRGAEQKAVEDGVPP